MKFIDVVLLLTIIVVVLTTSRSNKIDIVPGPTPDVIVITDDAVNEGMVGMDMAYNFGKSDTDDDTNDIDKPCPCQGTKKVKTPDGISWIKCPCGDNCTCKRTNVPTPAPPRRDEPIPPKFERRTIERIEVDTPEVITPKVDKPEPPKVQAPVVPKQAPPARNRVELLGETTTNTDVLFVQCGPGGCGTPYYQQYPTYQQYYQLPQTYYYEYPIIEYYSTPKNNVKQVRAIKGRQMLYFTATWCAPCHKFEKNEAPELRKLGWGVDDKETSYIRKVDIDQHPELTKKFKIPFAPCFVLIEDGQEVERLYSMDKEFKAGDITEFWYKHFSDK